MKKIRNKAHSVLKVASVPMLTKILTDQGENALFIKNLGTLLPDPLSGHKYQFARRVGRGPNEINCRVSRATLHDGASSRYPGKNFGHTPEKTT